MPYLTYSTVHETLLETFFVFFNHQYRRHLRYSVSYRRPPTPPLTAGGYRSQVIMVSSLGIRAAQLSPNIVVLDWPHMRQRILVLAL